MPPLFTIVTSILTIAITAALTAILWRINRPKPGGSQRGAGDGATHRDTPGD